MAAARVELPVATTIREWCPASWNPYNPCELPAGHEGPHITYGLKNAGDADAVAYEWSNDDGALRSREKACGARAVGRFGRGRELACDRGAGHRGAHAQASLAYWWPGAVVVDEPPPPPIVVAETAITEPVERLELEVDE